MNQKQFFSAATFAATVGVLAVTTALAGEVTGPPGKGKVTPKDMSHPNSICAFSGLNDYVDGPEDFIAQAFGQDVRLYDADASEFNPGDACRGGSNPDRP